MTAPRDHEPAVPPIVVPVDHAAEEGGPDAGFDPLQDPIAAIAAADMVDHLRRAASKSAADAATMLVDDIATLARSGGPELIAFCAAVAFWNSARGGILDVARCHVPLPVAVPAVAEIENRTRAAVGAAVLGYIHSPAFAQTGGDDPLGSRAYGIAAAVVAVTRGPLLGEITAVITSSRRIPPPAKAPAAE